MGCIGGRGSGYGGLHGETSFDKYYTTLSLLLGFCFERERLENDAFEKNEWVIDGYIVALKPGWLVTWMNHHRLMVE